MEELEEESEEESEEGMELEDSDLPQEVFAIYKEGELIEAPLDQLTMTNDQKEEGFMKIQIEETDQTLQIDEERETVIGEVSQERRNQLQGILQSYEDVI